MPKETRIITRANIEASLEKHDNETTRLFRRLMGVANIPSSQKVKVHKSAMHMVRYEPQRKFGRSEDNIPKLDGVIKSAVFRDLSDIVDNDEDLKKMLIDSLESARYDAVKYYHPVATQTGKAESVEGKTRKSIVEKVFQAKGSLQALPCPEVTRALNAEIRAKEKQSLTHVATESPICNVLPPGYLCGMEFTSENHDTYITVLRGEMVWIFWPRTIGNLDVIQQAYQDQVEDTPWEPEALANKLKDGVILGQQAKQRVRLPPLCIFMCVPTEFTVLCRYQLMSSSHFVDSLEVSEEFYRSCLATWGDANAKQLFCEHSKFRGVMIYRILRGDYESYEPKAWAHNSTTPGPLNDLIQKWDQVKDNVAELLTSEDAEQVRHDWIDCLKILRNDQCAICDVHSDTERHFQEAHWIGDGQNTPDFPVYERAADYQNLLGDGGYSVDSKNKTAEGDGANSHDYVAEELFPDAQFDNPFEVDG